MWVGLYARQRPTTRRPSEETNLLSAYKHSILGNSLLRSVLLKRSVNMDRLLAIVFGCFLVHVASAEDPLFSIDVTVARQGYDGEKFWGHARSGAIPPGTDANPGDAPLVVMTMQRALNAGADLFYALNEMHTVDLGTTWSEPVEQVSFGRVPISYGDKKDLMVTVSDFTPGWHAKSGKLLGTGHTVVYENNKV